MHAPVLQCFGKEEPGSLTAVIIRQPSEPLLPKPEEKGMRYVRPLFEGSHLCLHRLRKRHALVVG